MAWTGLVCLAVATGVLQVQGQNAGHETEQGTVVDREIHSIHFAGNKIGTSPDRRFAVYLPPGYAAGDARYPVIYYLPAPFGSYRAVFDHEHAAQLFDKAIAAGEIGKFIVVVPDMATPLGCSWYVNSPVTGNWEDFMVKELVPYVDANFRTLANRDSRGIVGDFMGGYGAIRFAMIYPKIFGTVYALHPVGTGWGLLPMYTRPDWDALANAKSLDDVRKGGFNQIFIGIYQAHLPDVNKPPLYIDLQARKDGDKYVVDAAMTQRLREHFFLEAMIPRYAENLKSLRGFKFDWDRNDGLQDHVYAAQDYSRKLNEYGIAHEAEEYDGLWGSGNWGADGRVYTEVLPFLARHMVFAAEAGEGHAGH
ncbi:alpha/beta hydrolase [Acidicapsa dinghuensis]|uniref:Alpha/beta hydrolase n=1 Tax=Acidicapsa dinghuensis TaxID=2218256 RepID=A0ABW1ELI2_9BACT|nr:esterase family protein [Acidicapsa dinghuensis]